MVGPFDLGHDRGPQLLPGRPGVAVEDVVLQQAEERLHGSVVASGADAAHRPGYVVLVKAWTNFRLRNCDPRSVCSTQPATSPRRATALCRALTASLDFIRESMD